MVSELWRRERRAVQPQCRWADGRRTVAFARPSDIYRIYIRAFFFLFSFSSFFFEAAKGRKE